jgi:hypothetical protein
MKSNAMKVIILFALLLISQVGNGQHKSLIVNMPDSVKIEQLGSMILKKLKRKKCDLGNGKLVAINIYNTALDSVQKNNFLDYSFLSQLKFINRTRGFLFLKKRFLSTESALFSSKGNFFGFFSDGTAYCFEKKDYWNRYNELFNLTKAYDGIIFFRISGTSGSFFFGVDENDIYVIESSESGFQIHLFDSFIDCCWNKLQL